MSGENQNPNQPDQTAFDKANDFWNKSDPKEKGKIIVGAVLLVFAMGIPLFSSSSPCSANGTYEVAEEIYGRFFAVDFISGAHQIGNNKRTSTATCSAKLKLENGEFRQIKYTVTDVGENRIWVQAQQVD